MVDEELNSWGRMNGISHVYDNEKTSTFYSTWEQSEKILKSGKRSQKLEFVLIPYCLLYKCGICKKIGGRRYIKYRDDAHGWYEFWNSKKGMNTDNKYGNFSLNTLCRKCYNKALSIKKAESTLLDNYKIIEDFRKEISRCKNQ